MRERGAQPARFVYRGMVIWLIMLVLLCVATWTYELWGKPGGMALTLPLGPGRQLHANLWKPGPGYAETDFNHGVLIARHGPLNIMLWYQVRGTGSISRLGSLKLVVWPLVLNTTIVAILVGWIRMRRPR